MIAMFPSRCAPLNGLVVNHKRVDRLYRQAGLLVRRKPRKRAAALAYFYGEAPWTADFPGMVVAAESARTVDPKLHWVDQTRYSKHRKTVHPMSGFIGEVTYEGDLAPFLPLLALGEEIHVGKSAAFGNGRYAIGGGRVPRNFREEEWDGTPSSRSPGRT